MSQTNGAIHLDSGKIAVQLPDGSAFELDLYSTYWELVGLSKAHAEDDEQYCKAIVEVVKRNANIELSPSQASDLSHGITLIYLQKKRAQGSDLQSMLSSVHSTVSPASASPPST